MVFQIINIHGSHFQGGMITWKYKDNQVYITYKVSFIGHICNSISIFNGTLVDGGGNFECFEGCSGNLISPVSYYCTDYSVVDNWAYGQRTFNITFPSTSDNLYTFGYSSCCWASLVEGGIGNWLLLSKANLSIRQDNGRINSSPISAMQPVVIVKKNCWYALKIPVLDEDDDVVKCRWANNSSPDECKDACNGLKHSILDQKNCILYINTTLAIGRYVVALQIEDFGNEHDTNAFSSIPLQFIVRIYDQTTMCDEKPSVGIKAKVGSLISIPPNTMFHQTIIARSASPGISEINTVSPLGMLKSELLKYGSSNDRWYVNVTWTPRTEDIGIQILCYTAIDVDRQASDQECKTLKITDAEGCVSNPCAKGSSCTEQINGYICTCASGYTGIFCETGNISK